MKRASSFTRTRTLHHLHLGKVGLEVLSHAEGSHLVRPEDGLHLLVGDEELLVLGVLQLVLLDHGPHPLDNLGPAQLDALLLAQHGGQLLGEGERFGESASLGHLDCSSVLYSSSRRGEGRESYIVLGRVYRRVCSVVGLDTAI